MEDGWILHADEAIAVVNKPSGLLSVPGKGAAKADCVVARLVARFGWAREVHRLDMDTSGLMVVALNEDAMRDLARQFREREIGKQYEAIVQGRLEQSPMRIDLPMRADISNRPRQVVDHERGKPSMTVCEVMRFEGGGSQTRVQLEPMTGRSHQLRVHLSAIGHPIVGDDLYGTRADGQRLMLHSTGLVFTHPERGERMTIASEAPF